MYATTINSAQATFSMASSMVIKSKIYLSKINKHIIVANNQADTMVTKRFQLIIKMPFSSLYRKRS